MCGYTQPENGETAILSAMKCRWGQNHGTLSASFCYLNPHPQFKEILNPNLYYMLHVTG